ncbi:MAG TPA: right-handed parallel beta-helix repeat-containing protein, partial [Beijerinckiaceae bacterium]|nr:right-handed parallel beta-helix repeat-containing protein [Beijerinckiaceae bacterium]
MAAERFLAAILALAATGLVIPAAGAARAEGQPVVIRVDPARKGPATDAVVRTVPEALARAAALRSRPQATAAIVIELAAGIHRIDRAIRIGADAGGRPGAPLILRGAKDGIARLSGSIPLALVKHPPPAAAAPEIRDRILAYRLPGAAAAVRSIEVQRIHSKPAPPVGLELFDDVGALVPARWPNEGWAKVERRGGSPTRPGIAIEPGRAEHWRSERDLWIAGYFGEDWSFETLPVATVPGAGTLALAADPLYRLRDGARFYVSHAAAELDHPGEWWR